MSDPTLKWNAHLYQRFSAIQYRLGLKGISMLHPLDHEDIMDLGCGNGLLTVEIARLVPEGTVTGIEASPDMIALAESNAGRSGIPNVKFINMDALEINFSDKFDAVFSNSAIHWIIDLETMYRLIFTSLRPLGRIVIQTTMKEMNALVATYATMLQEERYRAYFSGMRFPLRFLTKDESFELLKSIGFADVAIELDRDTYQFDTREDLSGYLESAPMVPFLALLPESEQPAFKEFFVERYLSFNSGKAESITTRMFISANRPAP